jgi:hypothetical protein
MEKLNSYPMDWRNGSVQGSNFLYGFPVNVDILTEGYFADSLKALGIEEFKSAILFEINLKKGEKFYGNLGSTIIMMMAYLILLRQIFIDRRRESSLALRYIDHNAKLEAGVDFGDMCSIAHGAA